MSFMVVIIIIIIILQPGIRNLKLSITDSKGHDPELVPSTCHPQFCSLKPI
jgi:hypothetical protein